MFLPLKLLAAFMLYSDGTMTDAEIIVYKATVTQKNINLQYPNRHDKSRNFAILACGNYFNLWKICCQFPVLHINLKMKFMIISALKLARNV